MHTEVHVHGNVALKRGVTAAEVETVLKPWFDYVDVDSLAEATSAREDEPGISVDSRRRTLEICWTGWVGRNFQRVVEEALTGLCALSDQAADIELTYYHEDGRDEFGMVFVGPTAASIEEARRRRMIGDVSALLARQFNDAEVAEVITVIDKLMAEQRARGGVESASSTTVRGSIPAGAKHLH
jgi:hypothetical protein